MNCSPPGSCVHDISQARILEWDAFSYSRRSSLPRDGTLSLASPAWQAESLPSASPGNITVLSVQSLRSVQFFATPWTAAHQASFPSANPRVYSNSCPLSQWCHPTISSSVIPFSSCLQAFPGSGSFLRSQLIASGGQSIAASASVLPMNIQDWFPLGLTGWISLWSKGLSRVFSNTTVQKHQFFRTQLSI